MDSDTISNEEFMHRSRLHLGCIFIELCELDIGQVRFIYQGNIDGRL